VLAKGTYVRFTIKKKGNKGSKGLAKAKHEVQGRHFGYVAYSVQRKKELNTSIILSIMHLRCDFEQELRQVLEMHHGRVSLTKEIGLCIMN